MTFENSLTGKTITTPNGVKGMLTGHRLANHVCALMPNGIVWVRVLTRLH